MDYKEIVNHITATITDLFEKNTEKFSYDKTFKAKITEIVRDGVYKIQYKGSIYKVKSFVDCAIDDYVTVCAPCNDWSELFVVKRNGFLNLRALNAQVISNTGNINQINSERLALIQGIVPSFILTQNEMQILKSSWYYYIPDTVGSPEKTYGIATPIVFSTWLTWLCISTNGEFYIVRNINSAGWVTKKFTGIIL